MRIPAPAAGLLLAAVAGCSASPDPRPTSSSPASSPSSSASSTSEPSSSESGVAGPQSGTSGEGTVVRFSSDDAFVDVTMGPDTPTTRDFLSLVPFSTTLEEFAGREKIGDPPRQLDVEGTPGSDPEDGDLIYFIPWGNLGFYYDTAGIEFSDLTPHLGTYSATEDELAALEGQTVRVEVVS